MLAVLAMLAMYTRPFPVIGHRLSHYEIIARIGEGGMGVVYKARDTHLDRFVAIKVLNAERTADPERRRRFIQEAKAASALNHPGIIAIYDINNEDGVDFIAMEFVEGQTLEQMIGRWGLAPANALNYAIQTAEALAKAHAFGIIHRDIKPSNIMVTTDGLVKVLDFGVAKLVAVERSPAGIDGAADTRTVSLGDKPTTGEGRIVGTIAYMSPEQAAGQPVDARSDIFSFGAVLYEMVTGVRAFGGTTTVSTLAALLNTNPKPPSELSKSLARDFERIILRCLKKDPARRFQVMADLVVELEEVRTESGEFAATAAVPSPARRKSAIAAMIAVPVLAAGMAAGALWLWPRTSVPSPSVDALTSYPGDERFASLSPDGSQVAFAWSGANEENVDIYVKPVGTETAVRVTTDPADDSVPAWSPDGTRLAFVRKQGNQTAIYWTPPVPGSERKLSDFKPSAMQVGRMTLSWTPDGNWVAVASLESSGPAVSLVPVAGGQWQTLVSNTGDGGSYCYPTLSSDGRQIAFAICRGKDNLATDAIPCDVHVLDLDAGFKPRGEPRRLTRQLSMIQGMSWAPDQRSILYGSLVGGRTSASGHLWRVAAAGGEPERVELAGAAEFPSISRSGQKLAYTRDRADYDLWKFDVNGSFVTVFSSSTNDFDPQLSPDGTKVAFATDRSGRGREIWTASLDGTSARALMPATGRELGSPRWSPDGHWIVFDGVNDEGNWDIYSVDAAGGQARRLTSHPGFENFPSWSRDGRWIYFRSMRSGSSQVWRMRPDGGGAEQVTTSGGASAWESSDGQTVYYTRHDGMGSLGELSPVYARPAGGGPERKVIDAVLRWNFVPVKGGIYYILPADLRSHAYELRLLALPAGTSKVVSRFQARTGQGLSASADGKTILYSGIGPNANADLMLIQNFR